MFPRNANAFGCALAAAFVLSLVAFGWQFHPFEVETGNSAEKDLYILQAEALRHGHIPQDPWHPMLYSLMVAGAGAINGTSFADGRVISSVATGLYALFAFLLASRVFGKVVALLTIVGLVINCNVITEGVLVSSDLVFSFFMILTVYAAVRASDRPNLWWAAGMGATFALAYFTRYPAVLFLPAILLTLVWIYRRDKRRLAASVLIFTVTAVVFLVPHFILTYRAFGDPFRNDNWKTMAWAASGKNYSALAGTTREEFRQTVLRSPRWLIMFARNLCQLANQGLRYVFTSVIYHYGILGKIAGAVLLVGFYGGLFACLLRPDRRTVLVIVFAALYSVGVCASLSATPRYLLPVLPIYLMLVFRFLAAVPQVFGRRPVEADPDVGESGPPPASATVARGAVGGAAPSPLSWSLLRWGTIVVVLLLTAVSTGLGVRGFIRRHPVAEVAAARMISEHYPPTIRVCGTCAYLQRLVPYTYDTLPFPYTPIQSEQAYAVMLRDYVRKNHEQLVLFGRLSFYDGPANYLTGERVPSFLRLMFRNADVAVYEVVRMGS